MIFKALDDEGYADVKRKLLAKHGLDDDPHLLARLENVVAKARRIAQEKESNKAKTKNLKF